MVATMAGAVESKPITNSAIRLIVGSSVIGTAVEWYDFFIYAVATALVFKKLFFPGQVEAMATIAIFGTYAVGYLARPLGAAIFGHFGDRLGRKAMLSITITITGLGTFLIGLLPTYEQIGVAAPALLLVLRFVQGVGIGGEWGGAVLMVVENAPDRHRGLLGSIVQIGNPLGHLAAFGIFAIVSQLPETEFLAWAWRVPFLLSIVLIGIGLFIRLKLHDTPSFQKVKAQHGVARMPVLEVLRDHPKPFFTAVGLKIAELSYASIVNVFILSYATQKLGFSRQEMLNNLLITYAVALIAIPTFGWLSDRLGRRTLFLFSCLFCAAFAFPLFWLLEARDPLLATVAVVSAITFGQLVMFSVGAAFYAELFTARLRYSGASLGFQVGSTLSGGLTPIVAASLVMWSGGNMWPVPVLLIICAGISAIAAYLAPETSRVSLD